MAMCMYIYMCVCIYIYIYIYIYKHLSTLPKRLTMTLQRLYNVWLLPVFCLSFSSSSPRPCCRRPLWSREWAWTARGCRHLRVERMPARHAAGQRLIPPVGGLGTETTTNSCYQQRSPHIQTAAISRGLLTYKHFKGGFNKLYCFLWCKWFFLKRQK